MRKNIIFALCAIIMMVTLTACGNEKTPSYTIEYRDNDDQQVTTSNSVSDENPANVDNSGHEPDSYRSGNFQDYWEGEDYFDIEGFAMDNGATYTLWLDKTETENISQAVRCTFYFKDGWKVSVITSDGILIEQNGTRTDFLIACDSKSNHYVSLCKENNVSCSEEVLQSFNTIVECLKTSSDKADPFAGSGLNY